MRSIVPASGDVLKREETKHGAANRRVPQPGREV